MKLENWDIPFYAERMQEDKFDFTDEQIRPYFPLPKVLDGVFKLVHKLFQILYLGITRDSQDQ